MSLTRADVLAYLDRLSTTELAALIDDLQRRLGMRPLAVAPPPTFVTMGAPHLGDLDSESCKRWCWSPSIAMCACWGLSPVRM